MNPRELAQSYGFCNQIAKREAKNFYFAFILLPKHKRLAMSAIYAFMRICDDRVDKASSIEEARVNLSDWRDQTEKALKGYGSVHSIFPALKSTMVSFHIPEKYLWELMDGVAMDLERPIFKTFDELYPYCYRVASVVGIVCLHIFGFDRQVAVQAAEHCGIAFQLTNIIRDIKEDFLSGRIYLPQDELDQFKVCMDDIRSGERSAAWEQCIQFQRLRAEDFFQKGARVIDFIEPDSRAAFSTLFDIYHRLLKKMGRSPEKLFRQRARLSFIEKSSVVLRHLLRSSRRGH